MFKPRSIVFLSLLITAAVIMILISWIVNQHRKNQITDPSLVDQSWLTDNPCKAPCWYGLEPGKSSLSEVLEIVPEIPVFGPDSLIVEVGSTKDLQTMEMVPWKIVSIKCNIPVDRYCAQIDISNDIVERIIIAPIVNITFEEVVSKIGEPDYYFYFRSSPEAKGCSLDLYWVERQMEISYSEDWFSFGDDLCDLSYQNDHKFPPNLNVMSIIYFNNDEFTLMIDKMSNNHSLFGWNGFVSDGKEP